MNMSEYSKTVAEALKKLGVQKFLGEEEEQTTESQAQVAPETKKEPISHHPNKNNTTAWIESELQARLRFQSIISNKI